MKTKKSIILFLILIILIFIFYHLWGHILYRKLMELRAEDSISFYESEQVSLFIEMKEARMSFGSGNKKMYLFSKNHFLLGSCVFGEFPMKIKNIDTKNKKIFVIIMGRYNLNEDYILSWTNRNKKIGKYRLVYEYE